MTTQKCSASVKIIKIQQTHGITSTADASAPLVHVPVSHALASDTPSPCASDHYVPALYVPVQSVISLSHCKICNYHQVQPHAPCPKVCVKWFDARQLMGPFSYINNSCHCVHTAYYSVILKLIVSACTDCSSDMANTAKHLTARITNYASRYVQKVNFQPSSGCIRN